MANKEYIPPEVLRLMELGRQKKLWAVEIWYNIPGGGKKPFWKRNMVSDEMMEFRDKVFRYGLQLPVEPHHWQIICPMDILSMDLFQQENYVPDNYSGIHTSDQSV